MKKAVGDIQDICEEALDHETGWPTFKLLIEESIKKNQMWFELHMERVLLPGVEKYMEIEDENRSK